jgi:hypothetical protein
MGCDQNSPSDDDDGRVERQKREKAFLHQE